MSLNHEKLKVYQRALTFNAKVCEWTSGWDKRHAIGDQLDRAAGSIIENVAMSSASISRMKVICVEYAIGSTLECAACLDLSRIKGLLDADTVQSGKYEVLQVVRMLIGLRKAWLSVPVVAENRSEYAEGEANLFHHERLDVYRLALEVATLLEYSSSIKQLADVAHRRIDELLTSMVLNIAEGNGRYSEVDQSRFAQMSRGAAVKLAARLDLLMVRGCISQKEADRIKVHLERLSTMLMAMSPGGQYPHTTAKFATTFTTKESIAGRYAR